jgi:hypothetical protein
VGCRRVAPARRASPSVESQMEDQTVLQKSIKP